MATKNRDDEPLKNCDRMGFNNGDLMGFNHEKLWFHGIWAMIWGLIGLTPVMRIFVGNMMTSSNGFKYFNCHRLFKQGHQSEIGTIVKWYIYIYTHNNYIYIYIYIIYNVCAYIYIHNILCILYICYIYT